MVSLKVIIHLLEVILCILYDRVALIVIPDCIEVIAFYTKIVTTAHISVGEQIQSLKLVIAHILLVLVVVNVTLLKFWIRTEEDLLQNWGKVVCVIDVCRRNRKEKF